MAYPYQRLLYCYRPEVSISQILIAARGSYLHVFDILSGKCLFTWTPTSGNLSTFQKNAAAGSFPVKKDVNENAEHDLQPSPKRRKTSPAPQISTESSSTEILVEHNDSGRYGHSNPIIKLAATSDGHHIVVVTGEDKCLRVLRLLDDGSIEQISERSMLSMPKRPCAITVSPDDSIIFCGDKFGDVYALPLLGRQYEPQTTKDGSENGVATKMIKNGPRRFVPSATSLTVHTKGNMHALKQQQQISSQERPEKKCLDFEHKLLFGHVSLLTDIACTINPSNSRCYILTSDRDEHIRVSRSVPYAHIIEGYCQGHTEFVSKLCMIPSKPDFLVTGGGDDSLILWDWLTGTILKRSDLDHLCRASLKTLFSEEEISNLSNRTRFAVSNLQMLEYKSTDLDEYAEILVTCEGIPALFIFTVGSDNDIEYRETYPTKGNVIDMVVLPNRKSVLLSMDNIHKRFSTTTDSGDTTPRPLINVIHFSEHHQKWEEEPSEEPLLRALEETAKIWPVVQQVNPAKGRSREDILYGLESLRKQRTGDDADPEPDAGQSDVV